MDNKKREDILTKMDQLSSIVGNKLDEKSQSIENITYCQNFAFGNSGLEERNVYIVKISGQKERNDGDKSKGKTQGEKSDSVDALEKTPEYEIYDKDNNLIATVDQEGKVHFSEEYLEGIKSVNRELFDTLELDDVNFEMPEELTKKDLVVTKEELSEYKEKAKEKELGREPETDEKEEEKEVKQEKEPEQENEDEKKEKTAEVLGIKKEDIKAISTIDPRQKITDKHDLVDLMPEAAEYEEVLIACTKPNEKSNGTFTMIGTKEDGTREIMTTIDPVEGTTGNKSVISINEDGSEVSEKQVKGLLRINSGSRNNGIAISMGDYGMMDIDYVSNVIDKEHRRAIPIRTREAQNQRVTTSAVREQGGDSIKEVEKESEIFREREKEGIKPQSMDGVDVDESDGKTSLEDIKEKIKDEAVEQDELSAGELKEFIEGKIDEEGLQLTDEEMEATVKEIQIEVVDEQRSNRERPF